MEQLPNIVRERLKVPAPGDHPDADILTAFAEQSLPERERAGVLLHVSRCAECRDVLALAVPPITTPGALDTARTRSWFQWRVLRWGAAVACVVIVGSAVLLRRDLMTQSEQSVAVKENSTAEQFAYQRLEAPASVATRAQQGTAPTDEEKQNAINKTPRPARAKTAKPASPPVVAPAEPSSAPTHANRLEVGGLGREFDKKRAVMAGQPTQGNAVPAPGAPSAAAAGKLAAQPVLRSVEPIQRKDEAIPASANETVEVHTGPPTVEPEVVVNTEDKREALGKAKAPSGAMLDTMSSSVVAGSHGSNSAETVGQKIERSKLRNSPATRWTISSDGQLQHSTDAGRTWQPVVVAEKASFRALSANGPDVWVGGAAGMLYHSADSGASWAQVKPTSGDATLSADIAAIEFTDIRQGKITTSNGEAWTTQDAGQTWNKQ